MVVGELTRVMVVADAPAAKAKMETRGRDSLIAYFIDAPRIAADFPLESCSFSNSHGGLMVKLAI